MIYLVGVGPGDPELITDKGKRLIESADIVVGWGSVVERFSNIIKGDIVKLEYKSEREQLDNVIDKGRTQKVVILDHGDPSVSDWQFIEKIKERCRIRDLPLEITPGVSSLNYALSREGIDMATIIFFTLHVRGDVNKYLEQAVEISRIGRTIALIPEPYADGPSRVAKYFLSKGIKFRAVVYQRLSYPDEKREEFLDEDLANTLEKFSDLTFMFIYPLQRH
ncbi:MULTISPECIES: precorrin-6y C5,15-methyltransferase (decarboxylating) subunit CbiE [Acidianus]|uniref:Cobalt-precorrin-6Y C(5)-methyltransferase n=1 Tax=Candidatus Acidianus copahuensis TaxID=1160895 RepID=A0A031LSA4_9CREN|nr:MULTISPECIES: precorrin-6y C5,15-methyltransferase (decarboxylating) subunit CbiE [Acidianus]EZQ10696.1 cobalt-precorrin-6Y C(5)-methyltransferase [Candidatus Acidianus copahuensis]NON63235.1 precorrin-6y C5,15-methyltransferase (decarboxylating) subunit CbiE [Acidianus sp. RZ1]